MPAVPAVYVDQQLSSLIARDAAQHDVIWSFPVQLAVLNAVCRGLLGHAFRVFFLLRQRPVHQLLLEFLGPALLPGLECQEQPGSRGWATSWGSRSRGLWELLPRLSCA